MNAVAGTSGTRRAVQLLARGAMWLLGLSLVVGLVEFAGLFLGSPSDATPSTLFFSGIRFVAVVAIVAWTGLATADARSRGWPVGSPAWAATSWLIPGVSFVVPFLAIRKLVPAGRRGLVVAWAVLSGVTTISSLSVALVSMAIQTAEARAAPLPAFEGLFDALTILLVLAQFGHDVIALRTIGETETARRRDEASLSS